MKWFQNEKLYKGYVGDLLTVSKYIDISALANKVIFISGALGLIGSCVAEMLLAISEKNQLNIKVLLGTRRPESLVIRFPYWEGLYQPIYYDALRSDLPEEIFDIVFHCASNAHPQAYSKYPVETSMINVKGTDNLLMKIARDGRGRMVYVSSSEVYGRRESNERYKEDDSFPIDSMDPRSCYPISKRLAENLCSCYFAEYGVQSVIVRPGHVYGPTQTDSDSRAHAQFTRAAAQGIPVTMKSMGTQFRSYCYVVDCASAMIQTALRGKCGEAYNIANPQSDCTIAELATIVAKVAGVELVREDASFDEKKGYARMNNSALDSKKLRDLGWKGCFSLERGVRRTIELLRQID